MKKLSSLLSAILLFFVVNSNAANVQLTVKLKNGDVVTGKTTLPKITVITAYGSLTIPIEKVSNLKLGIVSDHTKDGAVLPDLSKLQTANEAEAKVIYERLFAYGTPILSTVITFTQNPFYKISDNEKYTIEQLIDELYKKADLTTGQSVNDAVTFDGSNYLEGSVAFGDITIQAEYGNLTFRRDKIESLDISPVEEVTPNSDGSYKLKGNYHISGNDNNKGWLNTGVKVKSGDKFVITATGKVVLKSLSGGTYGPDGYVSGTKDAAYTDDMETKYGSVVYKIGEYGQIKQAGSKYEGVAAEEGVVYISIYETVYDKGNTGSYNVKVVKKQ
ncbi:MAG TPA: hypothetical protein PLS10_04250 [Chitinophagales bacterium]|nr:hypothetical protein [Chitinophagales bacterium]